MSQEFPDILVVDDDDKPIGQASWDEAQVKPINVRVSKVEIHDGKGRMLLQKRSKNVAWPGRWDTAAAGHVDVGENYDTAAKRELEEETGISGIELKRFNHFYETTKSGGKKFFGCYLGRYDGEVDDYDEWEVEKMEWWTLATLKQRVKDNPDDFTSSFVKGFDKLIEEINKNHSG